nr:MAG TPA: hypothetical protein [Bacteriophage sp.]
MISLHTNQFVQHRFLSLPLFSQTPHPSSTPFPLSPVYSRQPHTHFHTRLSILLPIMIQCAENELITSRGF